MQFIMHHFHGYEKSLSGVVMSEHDQLLVNQLIKQLEMITNDHESRIRFLERVIGYGIGALGVLKFVMDVYVKSNPS